MARLFVRILSVRDAAEESSLLTKMIGGHAANVETDGVRKASSALEGRWLVRNDQPSLCVAFERAWDHFLKEYPSLRKSKALESEADVQLNLGCILRKEMGLKASWVHQELSVTQSMIQEGPGRPLDQAMKFDLAIWNRKHSFPALVAEIKYDPVEGEYTDRERYEKWRKREHSRLDMDSITYHFYEKDAPLYYMFEYVRRMKAFGYLCAINEWYPDIEVKLHKALKNHAINMPRKRFTVLASYFDYHKL